ncbi:MAG: AAA family ATPase [Anaerolineales bacterium]|nr:MAG: AAA family ATPase [Anaerolineales bacterium]
MSESNHIPPDAASTIARLIEYGPAFGTTPTAGPDWPPAWAAALEAVAATPQTRDDRMDAFDEFTNTHSEGGSIRLAVFAAFPTSENRLHNNRFIFNAADAYQAPPQQDWCIEGLLSRRSLSILVGDPGSKKTLLALDLAVCLAMGKPWLGRHTLQCPVLFIDEETGRPRLWARIHAALQAHNAPTDAPFHYMSLPNFDLRDPDECQRLMESAQSVNAGLIVIDSLASVIRGSDENSVLSLQPFILRMRYLAEAAHTAVLIIHHNNKSGIFRGSSVISAGVDLLLNIESAPDSAHIHLQPLKTRDAAPEPFSALAHFAPGRFHLTHQPNQIDEDAHGWQNTSTAILRLLAQLGQADVACLAERLDGIVLGTLRNALHQLKLSGLIERADGGAKGAKASYKLSVKGLELLTNTPAPNHDY